MTELVDARVSALKRDLIEQFGARHDEHAHRMIELEELIAAGTDTFDRWAGGIQRSTSFTQLMAQGAFAGAGQRPPTPLTPEVDAPRPIEIDRAAAADPSEGDQRVDLTEYGAVLYIEPGEDPERAWTGAKTFIREERGAGEVRRAHRTSRP